MIFIVAGPGGVGKGTLVGRLLADRERLAVPKSLRLSRSWTTRRRRPDEPEDAYVFVDRDRFETRADSGGFLEWTEFAGNLYGTPRLDPGEDEDVVLEIELDGAQQVQRHDPSAVLIFVTAPTMADQEARLRGRGDSEDDVRRRLKVGEQETELGRRIADHVVVNDELTRAVAEVAGIIAGHQTRP